MKLCTSNLFSYLLQSSFGEGCATDIIEGKAKITEHNFKHKCFSVEVGDEGVFLKQATQDITQQAIAKEARFYHWVNQQELGKSNLCPDLIGYDHQNNILALRKLQGKSMLHTYLHRQDFELICAKQLANKLLTLKALTETSDAVSTFPLASNSIDYHWIFDLTNYLQTYRSTLTGVTGDLLPILLSYPHLATYMTAASSLWKNEGIMHGDLKWENLFLADQAHRNDKALYFIDWESVSIGDPVWDVASFLQSGLARLCASKGSQQALHLHDTSTFATALRSFWETWFQTHSPEAQLDRILSFTAIRLIQTAYEHASISQSISTPIHAMVATAWHILSNKGYGRNLLGL